MPKTSPVAVEHDGNIAWVTIDNPPVNATSSAVRAGLETAVNQVKSADLAILICNGRTFVAGGDISEFDAPPVLPHLPDVVQLIEDSETPFLAAMHGTVLGGGLELALACAWRIARPGTRFGLPEVNIGLIPGAGGTQRLPRLIGMEAAIDIAAGAAILDAQAFLNLGGLDAIVEGDLKKAAQTFASTLPDQRPFKISAREIAPLSVEALEAKRTALIKRAKGAQAPLHNLEAIRWAALPFKEGQPKERALHMDLRKSSESHALRHAFFAERAVAKPKVIQGLTARPINRVVVVGGGLMGTGIATALLNAGLQVTIIETTETAVQKAVQTVHGNIDGAIKRGKITAQKADAQKVQLNVVQDFEKATGHDLAIEAVFEDLDVKRDVFRRLAAVMDPDAILATNTSYLDPIQIFADISGPERCLGLHFFSPAHIMKLVEVVGLPQTSPQTLATGFGLSKSMRKLAVLSGVCDGFIGNRMLFAYRRAAEYMLADGAFPHEIDTAMRDFGMAMGPFEAQDMTGLQISLANRRRQDATRDPSERYVPISDRLCAADRFGQRSGKGWYRYAAGERRPIQDPEVDQIITDYAQEAGILRQSFEAAEIQTQLLAVLANEGALIVQDEIAQDAPAVDMVKLHGYGFPRWRGGPMHAASVLGEDRIRAALDAIDRASPGSFRRADTYKGTSL